MGGARPVIGSLLGLVLAAPAFGQEAPAQEQLNRCNVVLNITTAHLQAGEMKKARRYNAELNRCKRVFEADYRFKVRKLIDDLSAAGRTDASAAPQ